MAIDDPGMGRAGVPSGVAGTGPTVRGLGRRQHGPGVLPVAASVLIGRERERAEVAELLAGGRLVTLTGAGGCGKTRLAIEVAGEVAAGLGGGACWAELAGVSAPAMVASAVAEAIGVREEPGRRLVDTLVGELRSWRGLVVLDNCEHLVDACATVVAALLRSCPQVRVLATSRAPLVVDGETTWEVPPLSVPGPQARSVQQVAGADAPRLFELRAKQVRADFALTDDNAPAVASICRRLDGIPLAIELAAARVRVLSPAQIAAGLSDRFRLLTGGMRGAPTRQRTLEASVAWSYGLLSDAERLVLARLSVFAASFDLEAATTVMAGPDIDEAAVLDLVSVLADRSLLEVSEHDGRARYRLLETIRLFARERLAELDDLAQVRGRHLDHYIALSERAGAGLTGPNAQAWTARLTADISELRAAMRWAVDSDRALAALDIAEPTLRFWFDQGRYAEMERWLRAAVDTPGATDVDRARGLATAAWVLLGGGYLRSVHAFADRAVSAARTVEAPATLALSLGLRSAAGVMSGLVGSEQIAADADEAVALAGQLEDDATRAYVLIQTGISAAAGRTLGHAQELFEQAAAICEDAAIGFHLPSVHTMLGTWLLYCGDLDRAREHAQQGAECGRRIGRPGWEAVALSVLAAADLLTGDLDAAEEPLADAQALLHAHNLSTSLFEFMVGRWAAVAVLHSGATRQARQVVEAQLDTARERGARLFEAWALWLLGLLDLTEERPGDAREHLEQCRALSVDPRYPFTLGRSLVGLARLDNDPEQAWQLAHEGLEILADFGDRVGTTEALEAIAGLAAARDQPDQALRLLAAAERFHDDTGIVALPLVAERTARHAAAARAQLDPDTAAACWAEGARLSVDEAVAYARRRRHERGRPLTGWSALTPAECEVARLVAQGCTNADIAEQLFVSVNTVKTHLTHIYQKVAVEGRTELAVEAARREL